MTYSQNILCELLYSGKEWHTLNESNCAIIDVLVKEFGEKCVYDGWRSTNGCVSGNKQQWLEKIYDVLNMILFGNALKKPHIDCISQIEAVNSFGNDKIGQYEFKVKCHHIDANIVDRIEIVPNTSKIALVLDEIEAPFMFVVNQLCHQMIHQYVFEIGNGMQGLFQVMIDQKQYDVHDDQFAQIMDSLNKETGLLIEEDYGQTIIGFIESTYKARTMNPEYEGKEELGLYDDFDQFQTDFLDDEKGIIPETEDEYVGNCEFAIMLQDALQSSTYINAKQISNDKIQVNIT